MEIEYDQAKREQFLLHRGLDMQDVPIVFAGAHVTFADERSDYGELRWITVGFLDHRMVYVAWTMRGAKYRIITMRKANDREQKIYSRRMAGS